MEKKYIGNFGELTINISGNKLTGTYGQEGTIEGSFIDNQFKGTWSNKGQSGLLNFTLNDDKLEGTYKQGLDEGPMKGKWKGSAVSENQWQLSIYIDRDDFVKLLLDVVMLPKEKQKAFCEDLITFTKEFPEMLWLIPCVLQTKQIISDKIDDDELECEDHLYWGNEFNDEMPMNSFYNQAYYWHDRLLEVSFEDGGETSDIFDLVLEDMDYEIDDVINSYEKGFSGNKDEIITLFANKFRTVLYSSICEAFKNMDDRGYSEEDIANLIVAPFEHRHTNYIESKTDDFGSVIFDIISDVLYCLGEDIDDEKYEEDWGRYSRNFLAMVENIYGSETYDEGLE